MNVVPIVYHQYAHYRNPIIQEMSENSEFFNFEFYCGDKGDSDSIKMASHSHIKKGLKNIWIGRKVLFQLGALSLVLNPKYKCYVFLGNVHFLSTWFCLIAARLIGKRIFLWTHGCKARDTGLKAVLRQVFYRLSSGLLLYGHRAETILVESGFDKSNIKVVYNSLNYYEQELHRRALELESRDSVCQSLSIRPDCHYVIFSARLTPSKKARDLLVACSALKRRDICCIIIGGGEQLDELRDLASALEVDAVFCGPLYEESKLAKYFFVSDVCAIPGDAGLTCIHAMAYGCPVVTHDRMDTQGPEVESILPGETGGFFSFGDTESLSQCIEHWLSLSGAERSIVAERCVYRVTNNYTPARQRELIETALREWGCK